MICFKLLSFFLQEQGGIYIAEENIFQSLSELVAYYRKNELSAKTKLKLAKHYGHMELWEQWAVSTFYMGVGGIRLKCFFWNGGKCKDFVLKIMSYEGSMFPLAKWWVCFHEAKNRNYQTCTDTAKIFICFLPNRLFYITMYSLMYASIVFWKILFLVFVVGWFILLLKQFN